MVRIAALLPLLLAFNASHAETVWCRKFNLGCPSAEDIAKKQRSCEYMAAEVFRSALAAAINDPLVWKLNGDKSAEDHAKGRAQYMLIRRNTN